MDLTTMSAAQLRDLQLRIPAELKRRESQEKQEILNRARALAKASGYTLEDLLGKESKIKAGSGIKVRIKYRHPQNPSLEWTGRGRKPKWVESWLANGGTLEALLV
ncbi:MAG: H-NS histone family protein [Azonexus sp.]|jgi:DNA-binding protein H-NS|nr:H-NS histone family protein [Azonexus sp.]